MPSPHALHQSIVFIDASLPDLPTLQAGLPHGIEQHLLPAGRDGLAHIAHTLAGRNGIEALHLIAHGAPGQLMLGSHTLSRTTLRADAEALNAITNAMAEDGEWLIYGCEVAASDEGRRFVEALRLSTGLKVAAASHKVGAAELGGSWELDNAPTLRMQTLAPASWSHVLVGAAGTGGKYIQGDGSGGGGAAGATGGAGGAGGGSDDALEGTGGNDIIFGDGSGGGGGGGGSSTLGVGGLGGNGADSISGGAGNDIIFGDGFNGKISTYTVGDLRSGGTGGFGGGGGGGSYNTPTAIGGLGGGGGGTSNGKGQNVNLITDFGEKGNGSATSPANSGGNSATATNETTLVTVFGTGGTGASTAGGGGGGFGGAAGGNQGFAGSAGGTDVFSYLDTDGTIYTWLASHVSAWRGNNISYGGGNDTLYGGAGFDIMMGMGGNDTFKFCMSDIDTGSSEYDLILDYTAGDVIAAYKADGITLFTGPTSWARGDYQYDNSTKLWTWTDDARWGGSARQTYTEGGKTQYIVLQGGGELVPVDTTAPVFQSAATSTDGTKIVLTYDETLNATTADTQNFAVTVNGALATVTGIAVSGATAELTLQTAITGGQTVTVAYTDPSTNNDTNAVQDASGNDAATLASTNVTNNAPIPPDTTAPLFTSAAVNGTDLVLNYGEALAGTAPAASDFVVTVAGNAVTVNAVVIDSTDPTKLNLTLASAVTNGQTVTIAYTNAGADNTISTNAAIQDAAGNDAADLTAGTAVTNNTPDTTAPVFVSAAVNGTILVLNYSEALAGTTPYVEDFTVTVAGSLVNVETLTIDGSDAKKLNLTLGSAVAPGQVVTIAFANGNADNSVSTNAAIQDAAGNDAANLAAGTVVTNNTPIPPDTTAPTLLNSTPADDATGVSISNNLTLTFSEALANNFGVIELHKSSDNSLVESFDVSTGAGSATGTVTVSGATITLNPHSDLDYSTGYYLTTGVAQQGMPAIGHIPTQSTGIQDLAGNAFAGITNATTLNFTTAAPDNTGGGGGGGDTGGGSTSGGDDQDGVDASVEDSVPGLQPTNGGPAVAGDGNGDGIKDSDQAAVTSLTFLKTDTSVSNPGAAPKVFVTLVADAKDGQVNAGSKAVITSIAQKDAPANLPEGAKLPLGLFDFTAKAAAPGSTENFSIFIDGDITVNGYWKEVHSGASAGTWVNLADAAYGGKIVTEQGKTRLDFTIQDGGIFDDDGKADGTISDPGGPGFMVQAAAPTCPFDPFRIDADKDGMTDAVELLRGSSSAVKNNGVFSHNDLFVDQLYRDFFGREGYGDAGSAYWLNAMTTGVMSRADVLTSVLSSPEFDSHAGAVIRLYHAALGRSPELCGYNYWLGQANAGMSASQMGQAFLDSSEFATKQAGLDNAGFVDLMYHNVLQRAPEAAGRAYWIDQLQTGKTDRGGMLYSVVQSQEFKAAMVDDVAVDILYLGLLDRTAGAQETAYWMSQYSQYANPSAFLQAASATTTEYHDRFVPNDGSTHAAALVGVLDEQAAG